MDSQRYAESRRQVATLLEEYFSSGDLCEAAAELADMGEPELQHFLVKRAVTAALDKHNREREMTSVLLSSLYSEVRACIARLRFSALCTASHNRVVYERDVAMHHLTHFGRGSSTHQSVLAMELALYKVVKLTSPATRSRHASPDAQQKG